MPLLLVLAFVIGVIPSRLALAHSDASMFGGIPHEHEAEAGDGVPAAVHYPATLTLDPRHVINLVIKVNARITSLNNLYVGRKVARGERLAEFESAELETVQATYLGLYNNMDAVRDFSVTGNEKMIDARMALQWRGMSEEDIKRLEYRREPLKRIQIKSPATGFIASMNVVNNQILNTGGQVGQYTATGTTILSIAEPSAVVAEALVPADKARLLKPGARATVYVDDQRHGQVAVPAVVEQVFAFVNPASQRQRVRFKLAGNLPAGTAFPVGLQTSVSLGTSDHGH